MRRETLVGIGVNPVISAGFFLAVFGAGRPIRLRSPALDMLPQSVLVALMGALVLTLLLCRGPAVRPDRRLLRGVAASACRGLLLGAAAAAVLALPPDCVTMAGAAALVDKAAWDAFVSAGTIPRAAPPGGAPRADAEPRPAAPTRAGAWTP